MKGTVTVKSSEDPIPNLVEWIDSKESQKKNSLFMTGDIFRGDLRGVAISLIVFYLVIWLVSYEFAVNLALKGQLGFDVAIVVISAFISALATVIAGMSLLQPYLERNEIEVRYNRALKLRKQEIEATGTKAKIRDFTESEKIFLRPLIQIRGKYRSLTLKQLYDSDKTKVIFAEEKLLERLCL
jgi:hypothetical protein